jgi:hypothetical protein
MSKQKGKKTVADEFENMGITIQDKKTNTANTSNTGTDKVAPTYSKNGYVRPAVTKTDLLSKEQIEELLEDYKEVDDIMKVPLGVHLRYFTFKDGKQSFKRGGLLHKNDGLPEYVILSTSPTGQPGWSVQVKNTTFYRKMTLKEIKQEYQEIIKKLDAKNKKLKEENRILKNKL